jgi:hypothetical protein
MKKIIAIFAALLTGAMGLSLVAPSAVQAFLLEN